MKRRTVAFIISVLVLLLLVSSATAGYGVNLNSASYNALNWWTNHWLWGQCTWYAWGRSNEKWGNDFPARGNANSWDDVARQKGWPIDTTPKADSIAVWNGSGGGTGHVAYVESVADGWLYVTESNRVSLQYSEGKFRLSDGYYVQSYPYAKEYDDDLPDYYIHMVSYVTFDANGGSGAPGRMAKVAGVVPRIPTSKPTRSGYSFVKWNSSPDGKGQYSLNPGDEWGGDFDITYYAIWKAETGKEIQGKDRTLLDGDYLIVPTGNTNYFLDIYGTDRPAKNGTKVTLWELDRNNVNISDIWTVSYKNGYYTIKQKGTNRYLDVIRDNGSELKSGTKIQVWEGTNIQSNQQWVITGNEKGYRVQARCSGFSLDVAGANFSNNVNISQYENNNSDAQRWSFYPYKNGKVVFPEEHSSGGGGGGGGGGGWGDDNPQQQKPSANSQPEKVTFSFEDTNEMYFMSETTAQFGYIIVRTNGNINDVKTSGCELADSSGRTLAAHEEGSYYKNGSIIHYYRINGDPNNSDILYTLTPGTNYKFRSYIIYNGQKIYSDWRNFRTNGTAPTPVPVVAEFHFDDTDEMYFMSETTAQFGYIIVSTNANIYDVKTSGCELADASGNILAAHEEESYYKNGVIIHYFRINGDPNESDICYTLSSGTDYKFRTYIIYNGSKYYSPWRDFRTKGEVSVVPADTAQGPAVEPEPENNQDPGQLDLEHFARFLKDDSNISYHTSHVQQHIGSRNCKISTDSIGLDDPLVPDYTIGYLVPGDEFTVVAFEGRMVKITVTHPAENGYAEEGLSGWFDVNYLECPCSKDEYYNGPARNYSHIGEAVKGGVNLREETSKDSTLIATLNRGERVEIISEYDGPDKMWYRCRYEGKLGFIRNDMLKIVEKNIPEKIVLPQPQETDKPEENESDTSAPASGGEMFAEDGYYVLGGQEGDEQIIPVDMYVSSWVYHAGETITFSADILGGVPPFKVHWSVGESQTRDPGTPLDLYYESHEDDSSSYTEYTTSERHVEFTYIPPVDSESLIATLYVTDANGRNTFAIDDSVISVFSVSEWEQMNPHPDMLVDEGFPLMGRITRDNVEVRFSPGDASDLIKQLPENTTVKIIGKGHDGTGVKWYYIRSDLNSRGYIRYDNIEILQEQSMDNQDQQNDSGSESDNADQDQNLDDQEPQNTWTPEEPEYWRFLWEYYGIPEGFLDASISASSAAYTAGVPLTVNVSVNGGVAPFNIHWYLDEAAGGTERKLDAHWSAHDYEGSYGDYTTNDNNSSFEITLPLLGNPLNVHVDIQDGENRISNIEEITLSAALEEEPEQEEDNSGIAAQPDDTSWKQLYYDYILGDGYLKTYHPADDAFTDSYYTDAFGCDYYLNEYWEVWFALFDMDRNGVPELIAYSGYGDGAGGAAYAFTVENGVMKYLDMVGTREASLFCYNSEAYPGIFEVGGHGGTYYTGYAYLENGQIKGCMVEEHNGFYDDSENWVESNSVLTDDAGLRELYLSGEKHGIGECTVEEIRNMGWDNFLLTADMLQKFHSTVPNAYIDGLPANADADIQNPAQTDWKSAYRQYISRKQYMIYLDLERDPDTVFGEDEYYTGDLDQFALHDFDMDGIPELIVSAITDANYEQMIVFTFNEGVVKYLGAMGGRQYKDWLFYFNDYDYKGVFLTVGSYISGIYNYTIENGVLKETSVGSTIIKSGEDGAYIDDYTTNGDEKLYKYLYDLIFDGQHELLYASNMKWFVSQDLKSDEDWQALFASVTTQTNSLQSDNSKENNDSNVSESTLESADLEIIFYAETTKETRVRESASKKSALVTTISVTGTKVAVFELLTGDDGLDWYKIQLEDGTIGYARYDFFTRLNNPINSNNDQSEESQADGQVNSIVVNNNLSMLEYDGWKSQPEIMDRRDWTGYGWENAMDFRPVLFDSKVYQGNWSETYLTVLRENEELIRYHLTYADEYLRSHGYTPGVTFYDLTQDGIPEMLFIKADTTHYGEYAPEWYMGDLYVYSNDGTKTKCMISVPETYATVRDGASYSLAYDRNHPNIFYVQYYDGFGVWQVGYDVNNNFKIVDIYRRTTTDDGEGERHFYHNGKEINESEFKVGYFDAASGSYYVLTSTYYPDQVQVMSYDDAIRYLSEISSADSNVDTPSETDSNSNDSTGDTPYETDMNSNDTTIDETTESVGSDDVETNADNETDNGYTQEAAAQILFYVRTTKETRVRERPSKESGLVITIGEGTVAAVLEEVPDNDGLAWYHIQLPEGTIGYARYDFFKRTDEPAGETLPVVPAEYDSFTPNDDPSEVAENAQQEEITAGGPLSWEELYQDYILGKRYYASNADTDENGKYYLDLYGIKYYNNPGSAYGEIWFALHDMDRNGTPELLAFNGYDQVFVYTVENGSMISLGSLGIKYGIIYCYYYDNVQYSGISNLFMFQGGHECYYTSLDNGRLNTQLIEISDANDDIYETTSDAALLELDRQGNYIELIETTVTEIETVGWKHFMDLY